VKHAPVGGEEEDLDLTEQHRERPRREEQLRIQLWAAPGGPRLRGPPQRGGVDDFDRFLGVAAIGGASARV